MHLKTQQQSLITLFLPLLGFPVPCSFAPIGNGATLPPCPETNIASSTSKGSLYSGALPKLLIMLANDSEKIMLICFFYILPYYNT